eukprot:g10025.t1
MFRAIGSPVTLAATAVDSGTRHRYCALGYASSGHAANTYAGKAAALSTSHAASQNLSGLADQGSDLPVHMSLAFQLRNNPRLRSFQDAAAGSGGDGSNDPVAGGLGNVFSSLCKMLRKIGDAFTPQGYDTLKFRARGWVRVPRGHSVSEREWTELKAGQKVRFCPRIGATLIPTREESYPTPARTAECFFSDQEMVEESLCISSGEGVVEWAALLGAIRREAAEARDKAHQARLQAEEQQRQQRQQPKQRQQRQEQQKDERVEPRNLFELFGLFA